MDLGRGLALTTNKITNLSQTDVRVRSVISVNALALRRPIAILFDDSDAQLSAFLARPHLTQLTAQLTCS